MGILCSVLIIYEDGSDDDDDDDDLPFHFDILYPRTSMRACIRFLGVFYFLPFLLALFCSSYLICIRMNNIYIN